MISQRQLGAFVELAGLAGRIEEALPVERGLVR
jgi:hypothetical protein